MVLRGGKLQVIEGCGRDTPARGRPREEPDFQQIRLHHFLQRLRLFIQRRGQGLDADRAAPVDRRDRPQKIPIQGIEPMIVHAFKREGLGRHSFGDHPIRPHLSVVAHAPQQPVGDARGAARPARDRRRAILRDGDAQDRGRSPHHHDQIVYREEVQMVEDPKTFAQRGRQQPRPRRRADHGKRPELVSQGAGVRTLFDHEVDAEVLHRRIQELLNSPRQPMDLIDEQHVTGLQVGQDAHQVAAALQRRPGGCDDIRAHLVSDHVRQRRLAQPGRPVQQDVVERLAALFGGLDADPQAFHDPGLADAFVQRLRA